MDTSKYTNELITQVLWYGRRNYLLGLFLGIILGFLLNNLVGGILEL